MSARRILFITPAWPQGRRYGGQIRANHTARVLKELGDVSVLVVGSEASDSFSQERTAEFFDVMNPALPFVSRNRTVLTRLNRALNPRYLGVHGVSVSAFDKCRIEQRASDCDLVWVLNSRTPNILQRWSWPQGHLDIDDVPSTYHRAIAENGTSLMERWKARIQQRLLHRRELLWKDRFPSLSVCSKDDKRYLRGGDEMHVIPNGFERPEKEPVRNRSTTPPCIGFIGLYKYEPNRDGIRWFSQKCWPLIRKAVPNVRFRVVGTGTEELNVEQMAGVEGLGWMEDPAAEIATWSGMVIPIRFGGGTRVKIADGYSRKCPIVSTTLGAFGYNAQDGNQLRLADRPEEFAERCIELIEEHEKAEAMAERAWQEFLEKWTWDAIGPRIWDAAEDCLRRGTSNRVHVGA